MPNQLNRAILVDEDMSVPTLIKIILSNKTKKINLLIEEPQEWMRDGMQLRFLKRKVEEIGKKITIISEDSTVLEMAKSAGITVKQGNDSFIIEEGDEEDESIEQEEGTDIVSLDSKKEKPKEEKEPGLSGSISFYKKDKEKPNKERVVVKSEYSINKEGSSGNVSFFEKSGRKHTLEISKKLVKIPGIFSRSKNKKAGLGQGVALVSNKKRIASIGIAGVLAFAVLVFIGTSVLPNVTVRITPNITTQTRNIDFSIDTNESSIDLENKILPAQIIEEQYKKTLSIKTTGEENVQNYAEGVITIYNEYSTSPQALLERTRLISSDGKIFRTKQAITVPGAKIEGGSIVASSIDAAVIAFEPGEEYNIRPSSFSIIGFTGTDKFDSFYGRSSKAMEGGLQGVQQVVAEQDFNNLIEQAEEELFSAAQASIRNKLPSGFIAIEESLISVIENEPSSQEYVGNVAIDLSIDFNVLTRIILIKETDVERLIEDQFSEDILATEGKKLGDEKEITYTLESPDYESTANLTMNINHSVYSDIDEDEIFEAINGKKDVEARRALSELSEDKFKKYSLRFWPFWVDSVPDNKEDIKIEIESTSSE